MVGRYWPIGARDIAPGSTLVGAVALQDQKIERRKLMSATCDALISVAQLKQCMAEPALRIVDCRFRLQQPDWGITTFRRGHIPGAVYAHLDHDLAGPVTMTSGRHPLPEKGRFLQLLSRWGIGSATRVVCYDSDGGAVALRLWWMLRHWLGLEQVQLLDGGWPAWVDAVDYIEPGAPVQYQTRLLDCDTDHGSWLSTGQVVENLKTGEYCLLDARSPERFAGIEEPIDTVAGHIPFSQNRPMTENLNRQIFFKSADQLHHEFTVSLDDRIKPGQIVHSCGSGVTACHNLFAMERAGLTGSRLYPGSWSEWIRDPGRTVVSAA